MIELLLIPLNYGTSAEKMLPRWKKVIDSYCPRDHYVAELDPVPILGACSSRLAALTEGCNALAPDGAAGRVLGTRLVAEVRQRHDTNLPCRRETTGFGPGSPNVNARVPDVEVLIAQILTTVADMVAVPADL